MIANSVRRLFSKIPRSKISLKDRLRMKSEKPAESFNKHQQTQTEELQGEEAEIELNQLDKVRSIFGADTIEEGLSANEIAKRNFIKERERFAQKELLKNYDEDYMDRKLIQRPQRETVWGLGGQLLKRNESKLVFYARSIS